MFEALAAEVEELAGVDPEALSDAELSDALVAMHTLAARLDAATTKLCGVWDARRVWDADGARSGAAWLATRCRLPGGEARERVRLARDLRHMFHTRAAWQSGDIGRAHVRSLARARGPRTQECFHRDEEMLVGFATDMRFADFTRALAYWAQLADPDGVEDDADDQRDRRRLHLSPSLDGMWFGDLVLDPIGGTIVADELARIEDQLFANDWADARARLGDAATATVVTPGSLLPWLDAAYIERIVFAGPSRVIDVGEQRRLFTGALRRAIEVRDRRCYHDTCDQPADQCQIDHIQPWADHGPTTQDNGRLACGYHNRQRHRQPQPRP